MKGAPAFRAGPSIIYVRRQGYGTVIASRCGDRLDQPREFGSSYIKGEFRSLRARPLRSVSVSIGILIAVLSVFAISVHLSLIGSLE